MNAEEYMSTLIEAIPKESFKIKQSIPIFFDYYKTKILFKSLKIEVHSRHSTNGVYSIYINGEEVDVDYFVDIIEDLLDYYAWQKHKQKCGRLKKIIDKVLKEGAK